MSQQWINFKKEILKVIQNNYDLKEVQKKAIYFADYAMQAAKRFQSGYTIVIEITKPAGSATPKSIASTKIHDLYKIDVWMKVVATNTESRKKYEEDRALIENEILTIIDANKTAITGIRLATFTRFATLDEVDTDPIVLHSSIFITAQWYFVKP